MAGLLGVGALCNLMIRPVHEKHHIKHDEIDEIDGIFPRSDALVIPKNSNHRRKIL
jgi:hypothetical protein